MPEYKVPPAVVDHVEGLKQLLLQFEEEAREQRDRAETLAARCNNLQKELNESYEELERAEQEIAKRDQTIELREARIRYQDEMLLWFRDFFQMQQSGFQANGLLNRAEVNSLMPAGAKQ